MKAVLIWIFQHHGEHHGQSDWFSTTDSARYNVKPCVCILLWWNPLCLKYSQSQVKPDSSDVMNTKPDMPEETFLQFLGFISHVHPGKSSWKGEDPSETWKTSKVIGWMLTLSHSQRTNRISSLPLEPVGNSLRLSVGAISPRAGWEAYLSPDKRADWLKLQLVWLIC